MYFRIILIFTFLWLLIVAIAAASPCETPVVTISEINFAGNETTKENILLVELDFEVGDTVSADLLEQRLEENRKRLFNLRLFHEVSYLYSCQDGLVSVSYTMQERWYLYPVPSFSLADRNFNAWLERREWNRINYGLSVLKRNFRGRNEDIRFRVSRGFNQRLEFSYRIPYINRQHKLGLDFGIADFRSRAIDYTTVNNRQRFLIYDQEQPIKRMSVLVGILQRESVQRQAGIRFSYNQEQILDTVLQLNTDYYLNAAEERRYARFELYKIINLRESFSYPLGGSYFETNISQMLFFDNSGSPLTTIRAKYVDYIKLPYKFYYGIGGEVQVKLAKDYAYTDNIALGFRSNVRGYELYVIGGQHYGLLKQNLSYELFSIQSIKIKPIKSPKFNNIPLSMYFSAFTDAGYVVDNVFQRGNPLTNRFLLGGGVGLTAVTFYDFVFRFEYAVNREGNRGIYLDGGFFF